MLKVEHDTRICVKAARAQHTCGERRVPIECVSDNTNTAVYLCSISALVIFASAVLDYLPLIIPCNSATVSCDTPEWFFMLSEVRSSALQFRTYA